MGREKSFNKKFGARKAPLNDPTTPATERIKKRSLIDRATDRKLHDLGISPEILKSLNRVAQHLDPYEEYAVECDSDPDFIETLIAENVFSPDLQNMVEALFKRMGHHIVDGTKRIMASFEETAQDQRGMRRADSALNGRIKKYISRYDQAVLLIRKSIIASGRPLLLMIFEEAVIAATSIQLQFMVNENIANQVQFQSGEISTNATRLANVTGATFEDIFRNTEALNDPEEVLSKSFAWNRLAYLSAHDGRVDAQDMGHGLRPDSVHAWLNRIDFEPNGQVDEFPCRAFTLNNKKIMVRLHIPDAKNPFILSGFELCVAGDKEPIVAGEVARISGELTVNKMNYLSVKDVFKHARNQRMYEAIKFDVLRAVYLKYEREQVPEEQRQDLRELLTQDPEILIPTTQDFSPEEKIARANNESSAEYYDLATPDPITLTPENIPDNEIDAPPIKKVDIADEQIELKPQSTKKKVGSREKRNLGRRVVSMLECKKRLTKLAAVVGRTHHDFFYGENGGKTKFYNTHHGERLIRVDEIADMLIKMGYRDEEEALAAFWAVKI